MTTYAPVLTTLRALTPIQFDQLAAVPPALEWFANIRNPQTRRAYQNDVTNFCRFVGISEPQELRTVTRAHVIAWRTQLEQKGLEASSIRRKLAALASLFDYLCEKNAVLHNPVQGVKRPKVANHEGLTPAISDAQARVARRSPRAYLKGQARSRDTGHTFISRDTSRRTLQVDSARYRNAGRRDASSH